jgi:hypothetical protein
MSGMSGKKANIYSCNESKKKLVRSSSSSSAIAN